MQILTYSESRLVKRHRGTMPVLLTCPHGGDQAPARVSARNESRLPAGCLHNPNTDLRTADITEGVAQRILALTGLSPYVVIARFERRFIDANRPLECAFTDPDARPSYDEYHDRIAGYLAQIADQNAGRGFLFDIHGSRVFDDDPADIYLGTANGTTLAPWLRREQLFMRHGLNGLLRAVSYTISPASLATPETSIVSGGFTVKKYGGRDITAIQIEVARPLRDSDTRRDLLIDHLANALIDFSRRHTPF